MAFYNKSHGRKNDKETQSPTLKIFKEMINDPEKTNLLKEMQGDRMRKHHSGSRSKSDHKIRDSSSSDRQRKHARVPFKTDVEQRNVDQPQFRDTPSSGDNIDNQNADEGTCSCVSCALKKLITPENTCICGFVVLFLASVFLALYLVFKNMPGLTTLDYTEAPLSVLDSERLKRKIEMLKNGMHNKYGDDIAKLKDGLDDRKDWDDTLTKNFDGLSGISDFDSSSLRELNRLEDRNKPSSDLSSIIFNNKLNDDSNSERLRNFYKKLIQTDAQIRNLKKSYNDYSGNTNTDFDIQLSDRAKRSANAIRPYKHRVIRKRKDKVDTSLQEETPKVNIVYPHLRLFNLNAPLSKKDLQVRSKRFDNYTKEPAGIVVEEKKLLIQYNAGVNKKVPKCSHMPKETKYHEKQLKHPFYKNTQRLDELLDQFIDKNMPQILKDPLALDELFQRVKNPCKHPKINKNVTKDDTNSAKILEHLIDIENVGKNSVTSVSTDTDSINQKEIESGDPDDVGVKTNGVLMSLSTLMNPEGTVTPSFIEKDPRLRKLMQLDDKDEETLAYEDLNEVLADDVDTHDENDKGGDRMKRMSDSFPNSNQMPSNPSKYIPPGVYNPNWKGAMPLYPDELSTMIKQAALNFNKKPLSKDIPEPFEGENEKTDMEYIEDYLSSKNDRLANMAQAYSDYGVLEGKSEAFGDVTTQVDKSMMKEKRIKLSVDKEGFFDGGILKRGRKHNLIQEQSIQSTEGIKFELRPTSDSREDTSKDMFDMLRKHVKITHNHRNAKPKMYLPNIGPELEPSNTPSKQQVNDEFNKFITPTTTDDSNLKFTYNKGRRLLQSIDTADVSESEKTNEETGEVDDNKPAFKVKDSSLKTTANHDFKDNDKAVIKSEINESNYLKQIDDIPIGDDRFIKRIDSAKEPLTSDSKDFTVIGKNSSFQENNINMVFSDFFALLANWFSALDGVDVNADKKTLNSSTKPEIIAKRNNNSEIIYPMYDSEIIDNIGHRSRVLMSIEDKTNDTIEQKSEMKDVSSNVKKSTEIVDKNTENPLNLTTTERITDKDQTITTIAGDAISHAVEKGDKTEKENKTIVKRNVEDSNLIFWNDIYDDEYGIQTDPLDNTLRDKDSVKTYNNLVQNSKIWLQRKIKRLKENMGRKTQNVFDKPAKKRSSRSVDGFGTAMHQKRFNTKHKIKVFKRDASTNLDDDDSDTNKGTNFAELTENMKKVCQKAARAVQQTRNIEVREDTKDESVATSLMQQLVRLMTDLVDYQVKQKTCVKLPSDLSTFLVWLTSPNQNQMDSDTFKMSHHVNDAVDVLSIGSNDGIPEPIMSSSEKEDTHQDSRSECLGTLQALQDLMHQYDAMTDEDKSKMTGVRQYLESQLEFLNKQLTNIDGNHAHRKRHSPLRYKRQANTVRKRRRAKRLHKFIKSYSKKFTRTTASYYETVQEKSNKNIEKTDGKSTKPKRNLKDVYYKAILDAQKFVTLKTVQRKDGPIEKDN